MDHMKGVPFLEAFLQAVLRDPILETLKKDPILPFPIFSRKKALTKRIGTP